MINAITRDSITQIKNPDFLRYAKQYAQIETDTIAAIESYGLAFNKKEGLVQENQALKKQLAQLGATFANNGKSIHTHWLSSACVACRTGVGSYTTFLSLKCHRDCYFCFNPNQEDYAYYNEHKRDACGELVQLAKANAPLAHVALTGGEPLLHKEEAITFFKTLGQQFPQAHSRLYTAGDPLTEETAKKLQQAGLKEIRFSIKIDDPQDKQEKVLERIALARKYIPTVMVEMPVLPRTFTQMCDLLRRLDALKVDGINLLELCFPLHNAPAYQKQGFMLKYPPYEVFYNYWYAGGLAIAESENLCLELLLFALQNKLNLGVHYCSLENKHTGQIYHQNQNVPENPMLLFSERDYFFKSAKVFGEQDIKNVGAILKKNKQPTHYSADYRFLEFNPLAISLLNELEIEVCISSHIFEQDQEGVFFLKEIQVARTTPVIFDKCNFLYR